MLELNKGAMINTFPTTVGTLPSSECSITTPVENLQTKATTRMDKLSEGPTRRQKRAKLRGKFCQDWDEQIQRLETHKPRTQLQQAVIHLKQLQGTSWRRRGKPCQVSETRRDLSL